MSNTSFDKIIDKVFDGFKKITPALIVLAIVSSAILFLPIKFLNKLGLGSLPDGLRITIGIVFLLSTSLIITIIISSMFSLIAKRIKNGYLKNKLKKSYNNLSRNQKIIINQLCKAKTKSIKLNNTSGDTRYLIAKGFIFSPRQTIIEDDVYNNLQMYCAQPWLIELYEKNPKMFEL